ncbi:unnamed protein product [Rangifer tarandus platyrhynchus]|uniref:Uncharacterized protein n=1 Tax=Rangifer tarandus platyrhynchus TaxID=3082113 RepID=A0AC59ZYY8_RANTA
MRVQRAAGPGSEPGHAVQPAVISQFRNNTSTAEQTPSTVQEPKPPDNQPNDQDRRLRVVAPCSESAARQPVGSLGPLPLTGCETSAKCCGLNVRNTKAKPPVLRLGEETGQAASASLRHCPLSPGACPGA